MIDTGIYLHEREVEFEQRLNNKLISEQVKDELLDFYRRFEEETLLPDLVGKSVEVNEKQFPMIYNIINKHCSALNINIPKAYLYESFYYDVNAEGYDDPWIQISAKTIEDFTIKELEFMIGRQLCHIKNGHIRYEVMCEQFSKALSLAGQLGSDILSLLPGGGTLSSETMEVYAASFKIIASQWSRASEYSADNCGYLLCGDIKAAISAIKKQILNSSILANEMKLYNFINQSKRINEFDSVLSIYSVYDEQIPYGPFRVKELLSFASSQKAKRYIKESQNLYCECEHKNYIK